MQEIFVNAVRHVESPREDEKFGGWLFGIAHQKCVQRWETGSGIRLRDDASALNPSASLSNLLVRQFLLDALIKRHLVILGSEPGGLHLARKFSLQILHHRGVFRIIN